MNCTVIKHQRLQTKREGSSVSRRKRNHRMSHEAFREEADQKKYAGSGSSRPASFIQAMTRQKPRLLTRLLRSTERSLSTTISVSPHHSSPSSPLHLFSFLPKRPQCSKAYTKNKIQGHRIRMSVTLSLPSTLFFHSCPIHLLRTKALRLRGSILFYASTVWLCSLSAAKWD